MDHSSQLLISAHATEWLEDKTGVWAAILLVHTATARLLLSLHTVTGGGYTYVAVLTTWGSCWVTVSKMDKQWCFNLLSGLQCNLLKWNLLFWIDCWTGLWVSQQQCTSVWLQIMVCSRFTSWDESYHASIVLNMNMPFSSKYVCACALVCAQVRLLISILRFLQLFLSQKKFPLYISLITAQIHKTSTACTWHSALDKSATLKVYYSNSAIPSMFTNAYPMHEDCCKVNHNLCAADHEPFRHSFRLLWSHFSFAPFTMLLGCMWTHSGALKSAQSEGTISFSISEEHMTKPTETRSSPTL